MTKIKLTKKQKVLIDKMEEYSYIRGYYRGELNILKYFRDVSVDSIEEGYKGVSHSSIIKVCNREMEKIYNKIK